MFRFVLLPIAVFLLGSDAWAIQLDDGHDQIVAQYGKPTSGSLPLESGMGTYRWQGWRLDIEIMQGSAQRLIFAKDAAALSEADQRQLLNENGGIAAWQSCDHVSVDALAAKKWRRASDGAEAFTLANDPCVLCLVTKDWAAAWTEAHLPNERSPNITRNNVPGSANYSVPSTLRPTRTNAPVTSAPASLIVLATFVGFIGFLGRLLTQSLKNKRTPASPATGGLWMPTVPPRQLKSACKVMAPPIVRHSTVSFPISKLPPRKTVGDLTWQEFELMIGELYRRQGYAVKMCAGDGSDGGVDLRLRKDERTTLVQCKHWKVYKVGVSPVRELFGILMAEKVDHAILVTTGRFTQDASAFAAGKPIELIDGEQLAAAVKSSEDGGCGHLLDVASWSSTFARAATITTPVCPFCRSPMVLRRGKQSGNQFWGCSTYPTCRGKRNVRPELMRV